MGTCQTCKGSGEVERERSRWIGGGRDGYRRTWFVMATCEECDGTGGSPEPASDTPIVFGGHVIDAPGFTADQFERAMCRALVDELVIHTDDTGLAIVCHKGTNGGYRVTRTSCDCKAGEVGTPCKHRAALLFHLQVRLPAVRKQWAKLEAERPAEKVVA